MLLENMDDMSMLATVHIGNQPMRVLMDTGSPEQVIFSDECSGCGGAMYSCDADDECTWGTHQTMHTYGSGELYSKEAHTRITLSHVDETVGTTIVVNNSMVWLVVKAHLNFKLDGNLQGVFGLGPASSAAVFAKHQYEELKSQVAHLPIQTSALYDAMLETAQELVSFEKGETLWQTAAKVETFSFCLHPEFGQHGTLIFNDDGPEKAPGAFVTVPTTVGSKDMYWELPMRKATINFNESVEACKDGPCVAIMDTGTSLIGAPTSFVRNLSAAMSKMVSEFGCEDDALYHYPDLDINLGEHHFKLPPRSYVCKFEKHSRWDLIDPATSMLAVPTHVQQRLLHVQPFELADQPHKRRISLQSSKSSYCAPCIFSMDEDDERWLFGLPFFREYYASFRTWRSHSHTHEMLFAKASSTCRHDGSEPDDMEARTFVPQGVQHIIPSKLRLPPLKATRTLI